MRFRAFPTSLAQETSHGTRWQWPHRASSERTASATAGTHPTPLCSRAAGLMIVGGLRRVGVSALLAADGVGG
jgi:hypothetical protein